MQTRSCEWEEDKDFISEHLRSMVLNNYNNLLASGVWSNKYPEDDQILALVGVAQTLAYDSNKLSNKSNRESTKGGSAYIRDLPQ